MLSDLGNGEAIAKQWQSDGEEVGKRLLRSREAIGEGGVNG